MYSSFVSDSILCGFKLQKYAIQTVFFSFIISGEKSAPDGGDVIAGAPERPRDRPRGSSRWDTAGSSEHREGDRRQHDSDRYSASQHRQHDDRSHEQSRDRFERSSYADDPPMTRHERDYRRRGDRHSERHDDGRDEGGDWRGGRQRRRDQYEADPSEYGRVSRDHDPHRRAGSGPAGYPTDAYGGSGNFRGGDAGYGAGGFERASRDESRGGGHWAVDWSQPPPPPPPEVPSYHPPHASSYNTHAPMSSQNPANYHGQGQGYRSHDRYAGVQPSGGTRMASRRPQDTADHKTGPAKYQKPMAFVKSSDS